MSSLRNAVKRVTHKERSQPQGRSHLGLLEKKRDYKERAKDYHRKQDRIQAMREKAAMKNPDEFYFGMLKSQLVDGRHRKTQEARQQEFDQTIGTDSIRLMKDQDLSYIRMQKQKDTKKLERLQSSLHFLEDDKQQAKTASKAKHSIFVANKEEAEELDVAKHFDTLPELAGRSFNRPRMASLKDQALQAAGMGNNDSDSDDETNHDVSQQDLTKRAKQARKLRKVVARARSSAYGEMEARAKRIAGLEKAEAHLVTEKLVASKGRKRKIKAAENGMPAQYKWRRKRLA